jgi:hypothetical protein
MSPGPSPYDQPVSELHDQVENLAVWLAIWEGRAEPVGDALSRRCASDAVDAIAACCGTCTWSGAV